MRDELWNRVFMAINILYTYLITICMWILYHTKKKEKEKTNKNGNLPTYAATSSF